MSDSSDHGTSPVQSADARGEVLATRPCSEPECYSNAIVADLYDGGEAVPVLVEA